MKNVVNLIVDVRMMIINYDFKYDIDTIVFIIDDMEIHEAVIKGRKFIFIEDVNGDKIIKREYYIESKELSLDGFYIPEYNVYSSFITAKECLTSIK